MNMIRMRYDSTGRGMQYIPTPSRIGGSAAVLGSLHGKKSLLIVNNVFNKVSS
jgi:hypothetical protein